ncbi:MAG TPA: peptidase [bacterium]|nr:peptidase [bacterium]
MTLARPRKSLPWWVRWLHTYLSMIAFGATLLFAVTGLTLNHADWFEGDEPVMRSIEGRLPAALVKAEVDRLAIAEELRHRHRLRGMVREFEVSDVDCFVLWRGPAYSADATIDRTSGSYQIAEERRSAMALLDDLHTGRDCGPVWSLVIDVSAVLLAVLSVTGLWLLFYLKKRRGIGLAVGFVGGMLVTLAYVFGVR